MLPFGRSKKRPIPSGTQHPIILQTINHVHSGVHLEISPALPIPPIAQSRRISQSVCSPTTSSSCGHCCSQWFEQISIMVVPRLDFYSLSVSISALRRHWDGGMAAKYSGEEMSKRVGPGWLVQEMGNLCFSLMWGKYGRIHYSKVEVIYLFATWRYLIYFMGLFIHPSKSRRGTVQISIQCSCDC